MADQLITEAELEAYLQTSVDTPLAELAIDLATGVVQAACGQRLVRVVDDTVILSLDGHDGGPWLELPEGPVTAVGAVQVGATVVTDAVEDLPRGRLYRAMGWRPSNVYPRGAPSTVTVTYTHGYPFGDQRLQLARGWTLTLAAGAVNNPSGATREAIDDYSVQYAAAAATQLEASPAGAALLRRVYGRGRKSALLVKG
jgi:hypothetical protein